MPQVAFWRGGQDMTVGQLGLSSPQNHSPWGWPDFFGSGGWRGCVLTQEKKSAILGEVVSVPAEIHPP